jgi:hypothetical protein
MKSKQLPAYSTDGHNLCVPTESGSTVPSRTGPRLPLGADRRPLRSVACSGCPQRLSSEGRRPEPTGARLGWARTFLNEPVDTTAVVQRVDQAILVGHGYQSGCARDHSCRAHHRTTPELDQLT